MTAKPNVSSKMDDKRFSRRQEKFLLALINSGSVADACRKAGLSQTHGYRLLRQDHFAQKFEEARREACGLAMTQAMHSMSLAVQTLREIAADPKAGGTARCNAASKLYDIGNEAAVRQAEREHVASLQQTMEKLEETERSRPALPAATESDLSKPG